MEDKNIITMIEKVERLTTKVEILLPVIQTQLEDHNERIRVLETFRNRFLGAITLAGSVGGFFGGLITLLMGKLIK